MLNLNHSGATRTVLRATLLCAAAATPALAWADTQGYTEPSSESKARDGKITLGEAVFWDHSPTLDGRIADSAACTPDQCLEYPLDIAEAGARLRIGLATAERTDTFSLELYNPEGGLVASKSNRNQFNTELFAAAPTVGLWRLLVRPEDVSQASYRLRAKLESAPAEERLLTDAANRRPLYPNLRTVPPYEFTFTAPANPLNGLYPPDTANPPLSAAGYSPLSCMADEAAPRELGGAEAVHCLRLTSGPVNIGEGIYDMRFRMIDDFIAGNAYLNPDEAMARLVVGDMHQAVHYSDGSVEFVQAGTYSFHPTHGHFHDDYILSYYLFRVTDEAAGRYEQVGEGSKSGFCPADQLWGNWAEFDQGSEVPGGDSPGGSCFSPDNGVVGLSVGWGDVYRWQRPGQYVEFAGQGNGLYIVQAMVDEKNNVIELDETDNVSYAYLMIQGETIEILERGWGRSPWDPAKTVFTGPHPMQRDDESAPVPARASAVSSRAEAGAAAGSLTLGWLLLLGLLLGTRLLRHGAPAARHQQ